GAMVDGRPGIERAGHDGPAHRSLDRVLAQALVAVDRGVRLPLPHNRAETGMELDHAPRITRTDLHAALRVELDLPRKLDHNRDRTLARGVHLDPRGANRLVGELDERSTVVTRLVLPFVLFLP